MKLLVVSFIAILFSASAYAGQFYVLDLGDQVIQGTNTIGIKRLMNQQYPGVVNQDSELMSVLFVAKTRGGQGNARLYVGQKATAAQTVEGGQGNFKSIADNSYDRTLFENPKANSQGVWQLETRGNFNVRQMVVELGISGRELVLDYADKHFQTNQGDDGILKLRAKAQQDHGIDTRDYELESVTIIGKSRAGLGTAQLSVGNQNSARYRLAGNPQKFNQKSLDSFDVVEIDNPKLDSNGVWQVELNGNIKIREVILHMVKK